MIEGRRTVEAARKYDRIVQAGTQCRSHKGIQDAMAFLHSGKLGKIYMAKGLCYKPRGSIGHKPDPVPGRRRLQPLDRPGAEQPFNPNRFHYNWHWFWDYGNGDLGNQGIHQMDLARWGLSKNEFPKTVMASGGRFGYTDDGQTPNTQHVAFEFDDCELQFEVRGLATNDELRSRSATSSTGPRASSRSPAIPTGRPTSAPSSSQAPAARRRRPLRQLHQGRQVARPQVSERRHRGRPPLERLLPPRQYRLPAWPQAPHQSLDRVVRERFRGRCDAHTRV